MPELRRTISYVVLLAMAMLMASVASAQAARESLLWNPGPKYRSTIAFTKTFSPASEYGCVANGTTLSEAHLVGNPAGSFTSLLCENETNMTVASNGAAPTYYLAAMVGWSSADQEKDPGWEITDLGGGGGTSLVTQFDNHALEASEPCVLREVGYSLQNWPYLPHSHFKPNPTGGRLKLGEFEKVFGEVTAKTTEVAGPPACGALPTGMIDMDFRVGYENAKGEPVHSDNMGLVTGLVPGTVDMNGVEDDIFYQDPSATLVYAEKLGLPPLSTEWQSYSVDFKKLIQKYMPPPEGFTVDDAIISGFDVYSSVRGADLDFAARDLDVVGVKPTVDSDVNGDGRADLVSLRANGVAYVHPGGNEAKFGSGVSSFSDGKGGGTLDPAQYDGKGAYVIDAADVTGEGRADLVVLADDGDVHVYAGKSDATFDKESAVSPLELTPAVLGPEGFEPIAVADVNGDDYADLIAFDDRVGALMVYPGASDGTFGAGIEAQDELASALHTGHGHYFIDAADVTDDGHADLVSMHGGSLNVFAGQSGGTFAAPVVSHSGAIDPAMDDGAGYEPIGLGDVTKDGHADLALVKAGTVYLYPGGSEGSFGVAATSFAGAATSTTFGSGAVEMLGLPDVNGDGHADLAGILSANDKARVVTGQASGVFSTAATSEGTFPSTQHFENQNSSGNELISEKPSWRRRGCESGGCFDTARYVFYCGANGQLNEYAIDGAESSYSQLGYASHMVGDPAVAVTPNGTRYVYYRTSEGKLRQYWEHGESWNFTDFGSANHMAGSPAVGIAPDGTHHVFYRGANGQLNEYAIDGAESKYTQLGSASHMAGDPAAVAWSEWWE